MALLFNYNYETMNRIKDRLTRLYGNEGDKLLERLRMMVGRYGVGVWQGEQHAEWGPADIVLITYGDMVTSEDNTPLATLIAFLDEELGHAVNTVHILPFYPYSSDDGFSVIDYRQVDPTLGSWEDVEQLGQRYRLMFDLVLNHMSSRSTWFRNYILGNLPFRYYFHEVDPQADLSGVTRPRTSPLLTRTATRHGNRHVWTTFSADQMDLNFANPEVFFDMLDVLFGYIAHGARIIRLDAIAYLWKRIGTSCIHLPETHDVVKLFRDILGMVAPDVLLLTETNVPHKENISYFGDGDEAHMVYQFSLPPLVLHGLLNGTGELLTQWAEGLADLPDGCTYFNFTASHDGIGVRPLEGLVTPDDLETMVTHLANLGAQVSRKANPDGSQTPYELNITYFDALGDPGEPYPTAAHMDRFLCSQTIMLGMQGMPAIYFNSLFGARNHPDWESETGRARTINRQKWSLSDLQDMLHRPETHYNAIMQAYLHRIQTRKQQEAFHPFARQTVFSLHPACFCFERSAPDDGQRILCLHNLSGEALDLDLSTLPAPWNETPALVNLLDEPPRESFGPEIILKPYGCGWYVTD